MIKFKPEKVLYENMEKQAMASIERRDLSDLEFRIVEHNGRKGMQIFDANGLALLSNLIPTGLGFEILAAIKMNRKRKRRGQKVEPTR